MSILPQFWSDSHFGADSQGRMQLPIASFHVKGPSICSTHLMACLVLCRLVTDHEKKKYTLPPLSTCAIHRYRRNCGILTGGEFF